jgi:hypothetical protein
MSTPITHNAAALGGPLEATTDPSLFFPNAVPPTPVFASPAPAPNPNTSTTTTTTFNPGANGAAPTLTTTRAATVTDPDTGISATVSGVGTPPNFVPTSAEFGVPLLNDPGAQIRVIGGVRNSGAVTHFVTGVGATFTQGDLKLDASYRRLTPSDLQSEGTNVYAGSLSVGRDLRFTTGVTVTDAPGLNGDSTALSAALTAPLGNGWTGSINGRTVIRPGPDNDTVGGGLQFGNGNFSLNADLSRTGTETVGTVRFGVNF